MKTLLLNLTAFIVLFTLLSCNSVNGTEEKNEGVTMRAEKIEIYYFHFTRRCVTCNAVENVTKAALEEYFNEEMKNESIVFQSINLDESGSKEIAEKLEVSGQTLLIVSDDKKENLTTEAFMNAKNNPEKLKELIKSTIEPLVGK